MAETTLPPVTGLLIMVSKDGWTKGMQLSIDIERGGEPWGGYRLAGPKFNGSSKTILTARLNKRDRDQIREYLDEADRSEIALEPRP